MNRINRHHLNYQCDNKSIRVIIEEVAEYFNFNPFAKKRTQDMVDCRNIIYYLIRKHIEKITYQEIATIFKKDHSTVIQNQQRFIDLLDCEPPLKRKLFRIEQLVQKRLTRINNAQEIYRQAEKVYI